MPKSKRQKREEAEARAEARKKRGDRGQLARLIERGHGHTREALELTAKIAQEDAARASAVRRKKHKKRREKKS